MKLFESPDKLHKDSSYDVRSPEAFTFLFAKGKFYIYSNKEFCNDTGSKYDFMTHYRIREIYPELKKLNVEDDFKYKGRLWLDESRPYPIYVSFWDYPASKNIISVFNYIISALKTQYNINAKLESFIIEAIDINDPEARDLIDQYHHKDIDRTSFEYQMQDLDANIYVSVREYLNLNIEDDNLNFDGIDHLRGSKPKKNWGSSYYSSKYPNSKPEDIMRFRAAKTSESLLEASSEELYQKYYQDIPVEIYQKIVKNDPTSTDRKNGKYVKWMIDQYKKMIGERTRQLFIEDLYKLKEALEYFNKNPQQFNKHQIQQYNYYDFKANYDSLADSFEEDDDYEDDDYEDDYNNDNNFYVFNIKTATKELLNIIKRKETEKIYENADWLLISPLSARSACFWGLGTKWCTAAIETSDNAYDEYSDRLVVIINKKDKDIKGRQLKYQFHDESMSYMDSRDISIFDIEEYQTIFQKIPQNIWIEYYKYFTKDKTPAHKYTLIFPNNENSFIINAKGLSIYNSYIGDDPIYCNDESFEPSLGDEDKITGYNDYDIVYTDELSHDNINVINLSTGEYIFDINCDDIEIIKSKDKYTFKLSIKNSINPQDINYNFAHIDGKLLLDNNAEYVDALCDDIDDQHNTRYFLIYDKDDRKNVLDLYNDDLLLNTWISAEYDIYNDGDDIYVRDPDGYSYTIEEYK